jgi:biopolymer transport protein ExbD
MKISRKRKKGADIPTASTADIAFLLIIFFMATTKFDVKEGLFMVLPPAAKKDTVTIKLTEDKMLKIFITGNGEIMLNDENVGVFNQTLIDERIKQALKLNSKMIFSVKTDREAKYNEMIRILDRLKASGAEMISLSTN